MRGRLRPGERDHCGTLPVPSSQKWLPDICDTPATEAVFHAERVRRVQQQPRHELHGRCRPAAAARRVDLRMRAQTITIPQGVALDITGSRPIAFVADTSLVVHGTLDGRADGSSNGPGGGASASGRVHYRP
jgi:hypothetical protein